VSKNNGKTGSFSGSAANRDALFMVLKANGTHLKKMQTITT